MTRYIKARMAAKALQRRVAPPWVPTFLQTSRERSIPKPLKEYCPVKKIDLSYYLNIQVGDLVQVLHGRDQGKRGVVLSIDKDKNTCIVDGCNMKRNFFNPRPLPGEPSMLSVELPIHITNVAILDPVIKKPTRVKRRYTMTGECVRISKLSGCAMPPPVPEPQLDDKHRNLYQQYLDEKRYKGPLKETYRQSYERDKRHYNILARLSRYHKYGRKSSLPAPNQGQAQAAIRALQTPSLPQQPG
ncbi:unnamed protein product [Vitrella brassicaformis CCMP3155]|uniref:Large ribosomal subunit protein uL24c n=1 Tax=Vitrella brassicaformis (strain CCMP3155) TaxID=1169540 RepID=A0A0G4GXR4_VITBC|nr:unnamed protein product [Vitrella brassicaformis CCMP3155]|mmetsp:Transcript_15994/g.38158  ORF Transcript_15994/g.38158 Transcript_15994/m.38158 type:complete len:244 (+) Transcript_15994:137-868(+)|eukprot:CEM35900.1 unnamed protein product [Vitrella brassicaformis CCMP3155]